MLDLGLSLDLWPWVWLVVAVVFVLIELTALGGSFIILPFGVSAFIAMLLAFADAPLGAQWAVFAFGGAVLFGVFWRYQSLVQRGSALPVGVGAVRLVGQVGRVVRAIDPADPGSPGEVVIDGESWRATTIGDDPIPEDARVRILDVEGTRVLVEPVEPPHVDGGVS